MKVGLSLGLAASEIKTVTVFAFGGRARLSAHF
jgi:hypothetical protein